MWDQTNGDLCFKAYVVGLVPVHHQAENAAKPAHQTEKTRQIISEKKSKISEKTSWFFFRKNMQKHVKKWPKKQVPMWGQTETYALKLKLLVWYLCTTRPKSRRSWRIRQKNSSNRLRKKRIQNFWKNILIFFFEKTCKNTLRNGLRNRYPCETRRRPMLQS